MMWSPAQTAGALRGDLGRELVVHRTRFAAGEHYWIGQAKATLVTTMHEKFGGITLDPRDVVVHVEDTGNAAMIRLIPQWCPLLEVAEFRGGPLHHHTGPVNGIEVEVAVQHPDLLVVVDESPTAPPMLTCRYRREMWLSESRMWVFVPA